MRLLLRTCERVVQIVIKTVTIYNNNQGFGAERTYRVTVRSIKSLFSEFVNVLKKFFISIYCRFLVNFKFQASSYPKIRHNLQIKNYKYNTSNKDVLS